MEGTRTSAGISYEGIKLQIFSDLSSKTLARRRLLKPLTEHMPAQRALGRKKMHSIKIPQRSRGLLEQTGPLAPFSTGLGGEQKGQQ